MPKRGEYVGLGDASGEPTAGSFAWFSANPGAKYAACDGTPYTGSSLKVLANCSDQSAWGGFNTAYAYDGPTTNRDGSSTQDGSAPSGATTNGVVKIIGANGRRYVIIQNASVGAYEIWTPATPLSTSWTKCTHPSSIGYGSLVDIVYAFGYWWMNAPGGAGQLQRSSDGVVFSAYTGGGVKNNAIGFVSVCDGALMWSGVDAGAGSTYFVQYSTDGINFTTSVASGSAPVQFTKFVKAGSTVYAIANYAGNAGKVYYASSVSSATWTLLSDGTGTWGASTGTIETAVLGNVFMAWRSTGAATSTTLYIHAYIGSTAQGTRTLASLTGGGASAGVIRSIDTNTGLLFYVAENSLWWGYVTTWNGTPNVQQVGGFTGAPMNGSGTTRNAARCGDDLVFQNSTWINGITSTKIGPLLPKVPSFRAKSAYMRVA